MFIDYTDMHGSALQRSAMFPRKTQDKLRFAPLERRAHFPLARPINISSLRDEGRLKFAEHSIPNFLFLD